MGNGKFAGHSFNQEDFITFLYYYSFCAASTTIVSGAVAERMYIDTYLVYSVIMSGVVNPIAAGWAWGGGWLSLIGFHDYAGSGVVHLIGGTAAFWGTLLCGPRIGRFPARKSKPSQHDEGTHHYKDKFNPMDSFDSTRPKDKRKVKDITFDESMKLPIAVRMHIFKREYPDFKNLDKQTIQHLIQKYDENFDKKIESNSMNSIVQGSFILFVTWQFFNGSSGFTMVHRDPENLPQKTVMNTILAGSMGAVSVYMSKKWIFKQFGMKEGYQIVDLCCGALSGLVSITCPCNNVPHWGALIIGGVAGTVYIFACIILDRYKIDDPVEATQVHAFCGAWGLLSNGIFDNDTGLIFTGSARQLGI